MRKWFTYALAVILSLSLIFPSSSFADTENELTPEQIADRFEEITEKYAVGDELDKSDAEFVKKYAVKAGGEQNFTPLRTVEFDKKGCASTKTKRCGRVKGNGTSNHGPIRSSWGVNFTASRTKGKISKIKASATHTAYGIIGSGGIGLVYKNTFSATCKTNSCRLQESERYTASVAYSAITVKGTFWYKGGKFSVNP